MSSTSKQQIVDALTAFAPLALQEAWDNSGLQLGSLGGACTGVLLCVDCTPATVEEAVARGCNLIVSHHPLLFKGLKHISPDGSLVERTAWAAITAGLAIVSLHTCLDSTRGGISCEMARRLGATVESVLAPGADPSTGLGVVARFPKPISTEEYVARVKEAFGSPVVRASRMPAGIIDRIGMCGGSGGEFIPRAIAAGCRAYLSSDIRYHDFVDHGGSIFITDIGHYESEECAKDIFYNVISEKFANFAVYKSLEESNPIKYL